MLCHSDSMKLVVLLITSLVLPLYAEDPPHKPEKPDMPAKPPIEIRKLLSQHVTIATYSGLNFRACRHLTAQCPNQCGHAGQVATFNIIKYIDYKKPGKYGDPKAKAFHTMIEDQLGNAKIPAEILKIIKGLKKGDTVHLSWNHDYVTRNRSSFPERTITKLSKVEPKSKD